MLYSGWNKGIQELGKIRARKRDLMVSLLLILLLFLYLYTTS